MVRRPASTPSCITVIRCVTAALRRKKLPRVYAYTLSKLVQHSANTALTGVISICEIITSKQRRHDDISVADDAPLLQETHGLHPVSGCSVRLTKVEVHRPLVQETKLAGGGWRCEMIEEMIGTHPRVKHLHARTRLDRIKDGGKRDTARIVLGVHSGFCSERPASPPRSRRSGRLAAPSATDRIPATAAAAWWRAAGAARRK